MTDKILGAIPQWGRFEQQFTSAKAYRNPFQEVRLTITFTSPSGQQHTTEGFWDGGATWRVRFAPDEIGTWSYTTICSDAGQSRFASSSEVVSSVGKQVEQLVFRSMAACAWQIIGAI